MPQQTVYIRNDDMEQWKAIEYKSLWIHDRLGVSRLRPEPKAKPIKNELCKIHGSPLTTLGKCLQKGCKYA